MDTRNDSVFESGHCNSVKSISHIVNEMVVVLIPWIFVILFNSCNQNEIVIAPVSDHIPSGKILFQYIEQDTRIINITALYSIDLNNIDMPPKPILLGSHYFSISPDGNTIAYIKSPSPYVVGMGVYSLHTISIDGDKDIFINQFYCNQIYSVDWSPDGQKLIFDYYMRDWAVARMNIDGTGFTFITDSSNAFSDAMYPQWSPDGTRIACATWSDRTYDELLRPDSLRLLTPDGSSCQTISRISRSAIARWSPDGKKIAYSLIDAYSGGLYVVDLTSSAAPVEISPPPGQILFAYSLQWLPDNRLLCVGRNIKDSTYCINIVPAAVTSGVRQIADDFRASEVYYFSPSVLCSPDGKTVAVLGSRDSDEFSLYLMRTDGSNFRRAKILSNSRTAAALPGRCYWVK